MNLKQRARLKLAKMLNIKFEEVKTETISLLIDGEVEVGAEVFMYDEEGNLTIPADGEYDYEDKVLVIEGGIITEIKETEVEEPETKEDEPIETELEDTEAPEEVIEDNTQLARIEALEAQVQTLVEIIKEITGAVDEVSEEVESIDEEFKKAVGKSVKQPVKKAVVKQSKSASLTDRFFGK